jgi:hypothetical protein
MKPIDLEIETDDMPGMTKEVAGSSEYTKDALYPNVFLEFEEGEDPDLPRTGTITFKYTLAGAKDIFKKGCCSYDLDLTQLVGVTKAKDIPGKQSADEAIDEYAIENGK